jgi:hypothetical protein
MPITNGMLPKYCLHVQSMYFSDVPTNKGNFFIKLPHFVKYVFFETCLSMHDIVSIMHSKTKLIYVFWIGVQYHNNA